MKKLVLLLAVVFSVSLFSCGNKAEEATTEATVEEAAPAVEEAAVVEVDSVAADSAVVEVAAEVAE